MEKEIITIETIKLAIELVSDVKQLKAENERLKNEIEFLRSLVKKENKTERVTLKDNGVFDKIIIPKTEEWERGTF